MLGIISRRNRAGFDAIARTLRISWTASVPIRNGPGAARGRPIESGHVDLRPLDAAALDARSPVHLPQSWHGGRDAATRSSETAGAPRRDRAPAVAVHAA